MILFGPPAATKIAAETLREEGVRVYGRLFHPGRVDFGGHGAELTGLAASDAAIRDFCPSLYMVRVIERSPSCPAFQQTMADNPAATYLAFDDPNCLFVACLPRPDVIGMPSGWRQDMWNFFFSLCSLEEPDNSPWGTIVASVGDQALLDFEVACPHAHSDIASWLWNKGLTTSGKPNFLVLPWGGGAAARGPALDALHLVRRQWRHCRQLPVGPMEAAINRLSHSSLNDSFMLAAQFRRERLLALATRLGIDETSEKPFIHDKAGEVRNLQRAVL
jgi:hypothetical protein